jgi:hypothetical protein
MKPQIIILLVILTLINSCTQTESKFPQGAWSLVQGDAIYGGDSIVNLTPSQYVGSDVKIWTEHHFNYVGLFKHDTTFLDHFGGGTYTLDGNRYEENIIWDYKKDVVGKKIKMLLELKNDTLNMTFPVDDNWQKDKNFYWIVKYVKLE